MSGTDTSRFLKFSVLCVAATYCLCLLIFHPRQTYGLRTIYPAIQSSLMLFSYYVLGTKYVGKIQTLTIGFLSGLICGTAAHVINIALGDFILHVGDRSLDYFYLNLPNMFLYAAFTLMPLLGIFVFCLGHLIYKRAGWTIG